MTDLTDADAPYVPVRPTKLIAYSSGHKIPWLDQNNEFKADALTLTSNNAQVGPSRVVTGGTAHAGDTVGVRLAFAGVTRDYTYVVQPGDTLVTINSALIALMDADAAHLANNNIFGFFGSAPELTWWVMGPRGKSPVVTDISTGGHTTFTITPSDGKLDVDNCQINWQRVAIGGTPLAGDCLHAMQWAGQTTSSGDGVGAVYSQMGTYILDPVTGKGRWFLATQGAYMTFDEGGLYIGGPPGIGIKINSTSVYGDEESTWTPSLKGRTTAGTPNYTGGGAAGNYLKRGRWVEVQGFVKGSLSGASGDLILGGLPYPVREIQSAGTLGYFSGVTLGAGYSALGIMGDVNASTIAFFKSGGSAAAALQVGEIGTINTRFYMKYKTD